MSNLLDPEHKHGLVKIRKMTFYPEHKSPFLENFDCSKNSKRLKIIQYWALRSGEVN